MEIEQARAHFSEILSLDQPVSEAAILAMTENPDYLAHLIDKRNSGRLFEVMLANPPKSTEANDAEQAAGFGKLINSISTWAKSGFKTAPAELVKERLSICRTCPNIREPSGKFLDRVGKTIGMDGHVCSLCGCYVKPKAQMLTERCPDRDASVPGTTRWTANQMPSGDNIGLEE